VDISDDLELAPSADVPQFAEITPVEPDNTALKCMGIKVVIQYEVGDAGAAAVAMAEQEGTAFAACVSAALA
jgi:hypothetical protein